MPLKAVEKKQPFHPRRSHTPFPGLLYPLKPSDNRRTDFDAPRCFSWGNGSRAIPRPEGQRFVPAAPGSSPAADAAPPRRPGPEPRGARGKLNPRWAL